MLACCLVAFATAADQFNPPPGYYDGITGTGADLENQLYELTRSRQVQRRYGDFRFSAAITDADPKQPGNILLAYNRASVSATWDSGNTWNREHVWPQSLQPGSASNSTTGHLGDPHALRPSDPGINSSRGNRPFGFAETTGSFGGLSGGYYFPGDDDKGDIARQLFYSETRYGRELGIDLVLGFPGSNQMGDLASLLQWHLLDPPDEFERRRNHTIYSQAENPSYYTNNRNPYIDDPEFAYHVFALPGDATLDFAVEQGDLDAVLQNWGNTSAVWTTGDFTRDGRVDQSDLDVVLQNWANVTAPSFRGTGLPEPPHTVTLVCVFAASIRRGVLRSE